MKRIYPIFILLALLTGAILLHNCRGPQEAAVAGPVHVDPAALPYKTLSEYAFFRGELRELHPNERVLPYDLITPLFTDYAHKARFVWMPDSVQAVVNDQGEIEFPNNTVLIKTFYYPADFRRPADDHDLVETRLLVRRAGKWEAFTYVWNDDQTDADLQLVGDFRPVAWIDEAGRRQAIDYVVPNKNQCKSCHNFENTIQPIGPKVRNLNRSVTYPDGATANQLDRWQAAGILAAGDYTDRFAPVADWRDSTSGSPEDRALAYLDVNCGHCHRPGGPAHTSGLYLTVDYRDEPGRLGVYKTPVAAGKGSGGRTFGIVPGQPDSSIVLFRMESADPGIMMPELGRVIPHQEGIALIREWIKEME